MLKVFEDIKKHVKISKKGVVIDNLAFRLHYRFTFGALLICTVMVCGRQYIGEHIKCIADKGITPAVSKGVSRKVIESFCFFSSTFTVVRHLSGDRNDGMVPHPGVGPYVEGEPTIRHAYYQWVPFVLFGQALLFYLPHFVWKTLEGGQIKSMSMGFEPTALDLRDAYIQAEKRDQQTTKQREAKINQVRTAFFQRLHLSRYWALGLVGCELLNLLNLVLQVWLMDVLLGGRFIGYGPLVMGADPADPVHPMDLVFPKVTKCTFHKYGPSGSLQQHDALCVMALNVINEKIYIFLWFWFIILFVITAISLIYRLFSLVLYKRSLAFNKLVFKYSSAATLDDKSLMVVFNECYFSDWLILNYLALSMDGFAFKELTTGLVDTMRGLKNAKQGRAALLTSDDDIIDIVDDDDTLKNK